jgi:hypothetical protein
LYSLKSKPSSNFANGKNGIFKRRKLVDFRETEANQVFDELARWEQVLKDTSLARPAPPLP